ncbi:MAG TPA: hypothetical protein DCM87_11115 [Planctomycetes bacterium]|nr:hypothetical protein [Planctomycetota bacterium]
MRNVLASIIGVGALLAGCVGVNPHMVNAEFEKEILRREAAYRLKPQDSISVTVVAQPGFSQTPVIVKNDGYIDLLLGRFLVAGLTTAEAEQTIATQQKEFQNVELRIVVAVVAPASEVVWVAGEVQRPSVVTLRPGMSAMEAVFEAGGNLPSGKLREILLIREGPDRTRHIRYVNLKIKEEDLTLLPRDMVYVPRTVVANIATFLDQYIYRLTPVSYITPVLMYSSLAP